MIWRARGIVIVSGLARGVDSAAHRGALDARRQDHCRARHGDRSGLSGREQGSARTHRGEGLLVTEFPPGAPPDLFHFPQRNRIISGLSKAVVVVEAREKSGSLITARLAGDQGRDVMVVPGPIVERPEPGRPRALEGWGKACRVCGRYPARVRARVRAALDACGESRESVEFTVDDVARQLQVTPGEALARLLEWELTGEIQRIGSGRFVRSRSKV